MRTVLVLLLSAAFVSIVRADSGPSTIASIVAESVRPEAAALAAQRTRVDRLPVYTLEIDLAASMDAFALREEISFAHQGPGGLEHALLFVYANLGGAVGHQGGAAVLLVEGKCTSSPSCTVTAESPGVLRAVFERPLRAGEVARISLSLEARLKRLPPARTSFSGQTLEALTSLLRGGEASDYGLLAVADGVLSAGGFMAVLAPRHAHGGWGSPPQKAFGDLTSDDLAHVTAKLRAPPGVHVASVGRISGEREGPAGFREYTIHAGLARDFAFVAGSNPEVLERQVGDVLVRMHLSKRAREHGTRVLETASEALELFERSFGAYPYRELEVVEAPLLGGVGGVEFSGMVTIASSLLEAAREDGVSNVLSALSGLLGSQGDALVADRMEMLDMVVAHEVAHQWWHVFVGSDSREEPFVDEGLAQWSALFYLERQRGSTVARRASRQLAMSYQTMRLLGEPDGVVRQPVDSFRTQQAYAGLVYGKGPLAYERLRKLLGEKRFLAALAAYTKRYAFRAAPRHGFEEIAGAVAGKRSVRAITRRWWDERHGDEDLGSLALGDHQFDLKALLGNRRGADEAEPLGGDALNQMKTLMEQLLRSGD